MRSRSITFAGIVMMAWGSASALAADGKAVYAQTCAACHASGVANAPKLGDKAAISHHSYLAKRAGMRLNMARNYGGKTTTPITMQGIRIGPLALVTTGLGRVAEAFLLLMPAFAVLGVLGVLAVTAVPRSPQPAPRLGVRSGNSATATRPRRRRCGLSFSCG